MTQSDNENRRSVRFADTLAPGDSNRYTKEIERDATVEQVDVRIYRGAELDLHVRPFVVRDSREFALVEFQGKEYVDGDSDHWTFPVSEAVQESDEIGVEVEHVADQYQLDFAADMMLDRAGGTSRFGGMIDSMIDAIRGVF